MTTDPVRPGGPGRRRVVAAVLAGGVGTRLGGDRPKQLLSLGGRTVLELAVLAFVDSEDVDEVLVVMPAALVAEAQALFAAGRLDTVRVIPGGVARTDSTRAAIEAIAASPGGEDCDVLLHDAARPLVDARVIRDCVAALQSAEAVVPAIPATDTVVVVAPGDLVSSVPDREQLRNVQTPQGFRLAVIRAAYRLAQADHGEGSVRASDDCGVLLRYLPSVPVRLVAGSVQNIKITHPGDLALAEELLRLRGRP